MRAVYLRAVRGFLLRQARRAGLVGSDTGAVCFTQRFGSSLNLNVHFHALFLDGVYAPDEDGVPRFIYGKTHVDTCGSSTPPVASGGYFGQNFMEYYIR